MILVFIAVVGVLQPYYRPRRHLGASRADLNLQIYQEQIATLDQDVANGLLSPEQAMASRAEIESRVVHEVVEEPIVIGSQRFRGTVLAIALCIPIVAVGTYAVVGAPEAVWIASMSSPRSSLHAGVAGVGSPEVRTMVEGLAKKLEQHPEDLQGWAMLARSYKVLGDTVAAEKAYDRAGSWVMKDAQLLADYADVAVANAQGNFLGKPTRLIERALAVNPQHPMALWLAATAAMQRQDPGAAQGYFERLLKVLPPDSDDARMIETTIVRLRGGGRPK